jgi:predicted nucleotidyltransferase
VCKGRTLSRLFSPAARVKVRPLFLTPPGRDFDGREIARLAGLLPRAVHRERARLTRIGLLERVRRGSRASVRVNRNHPIFPELRAIFLKTIAVGDELRGALADREGIKRAFIHGSVTANTGASESDIDLFIDGNTTLSDITSVLSRLEHSRRRKINTAVYPAADVVKRTTQEDPFIGSVLAQPKIFLIGTEEALTGRLT